METERRSTPGLLGYSMAEIIRKVAAVVCVPRREEKEAERPPKSLGRRKHAADHLLQHG